MSAGSLGPADVHELARLAQLLLPDDQVQAVAQRLQLILDAFAQLRSVDTREVQPSPYPLPLPLPLRADEPGPVLSQDEVLANAPAQAAGAFLVPRVVAG